MYKIDLVFLGRALFAFFLRYVCVGFGSFCRLWFGVFAMSAKRHVLTNVVSLFYLQLSCELPKTKS
jgi:hypothetical protein